MQNKLAPLIFWLVLAALAGAAAGYFFGYDHGFEKAADETLPQQISSFEECVAAGYPVMESYPERCAVPGGRQFTKAYPNNSPNPLSPPYQGEMPPALKVPEEEAVFCTQDAKQCPDGSFVSRVGPNCEFAPCPGE